MPRLPHLLLIIAVAFALLSCSSARKSKPAAGTDQPSEPRAHTHGEIIDDTFETPPPRTTVSAVMEAKLAHAQAVLEAISLADYAMVESNAMALKRISQGGDWLVHDSATYFEFSAEFRSACDDLIHHAQAQNVPAMTQAYANLTNTCVACHSYLRNERQTNDLPGRVSMGE
jgi:hypothetical protein